MLAAPVGALDLPSGLKVTLSEVLVDPVGSETWLRFRFLSPQVARGTTGAFEFAQIEGDFQAICDGLAMPYMAQHGLNADKIVISISDRKVPFGVSDPEATQFFEQFRAENGLCIWEAF